MFTEIDVIKAPIIHNRFYLVGVVRVYNSDEGPVDNTPVSHSHYEMIGLVDFRLQVCPESLGIY